MDSYYGFQVLLVSRERTVASCKYTGDLPYSHLFSLPFQNWKTIAQLNLKHLADGCRGERLRSGVNMTIAGAPNVGKSSLLNFLSKKPTAIVSDIPGTTRDIVKTDLDIGGYPVNVRDTAGLRKDTSDVVELEGINRARAALDETDLILVVLDAQIVASASNLQTAMINISSYIDSLGVPALRDVMGSRPYSSVRKCIVIVNKMDLIVDKALMQALKLEFGDGLCLISCKTKEGMDEMMQSLSSCLKELCGNPSSENPCFTQPRHRYCLEETCNALARFSSYTDAEVDLAAQEMRNALYSLGKITGHVTIEDILDIIFKEFCIGK
uniref:tRNA modification GTPase GTPBP3, mitochondrial n=1 Tax=Lygus hesperus TaxID=30085 RepID=A0A0A9WSP7_LYGHE